MSRKTLVFRDSPHGIGRLEMSCKHDAESGELYSLDPVVGDDRIDCGLSATKYGAPPANGDG